MLGTIARAVNDGPAGPHVKGPRGWAVLLTMGLLTASSPQARAVGGLSPAQRAWVEPLLAAYAAAKDPGRALWPGYSPLFEPLLLYFDDAARRGAGVAVLLAHPSSPAGFRPAEEGDKQIAIPTLPILMKTDAAPPSTARFGVVEVAGRPCFYWRVRPGDAADAALPTLAHESFHSFQDRWRDAYRARNGRGRPPRASAEELADVEIEHILLARALMGPDTETAAREFTTLRSLRHRKMAEAERRWESYEEFNEGTAYWVEVRFAEAFAAGVRRGGLGRRRIVRQLLEGVLNRESEGKKSYYGSGAAMAAMLSDSGVGWQERVSGGTPIFAVFRETYPPYPDAESVGVGLRRRYRHDAFSRAAADRLAEKEAFDERLQASFEGDRGFRLVLIGAEQPRSYGQLQTLTTFPDGSFISSSVESESSLDGVYSLQLFGARVRVRPGPPARQEFLLGDEVGVRVSIDGRPAARVENTRFSRLEVASPKGRFTILVPGTVRRSGRALLVDSPALGLRP